MKKVLLVLLLLLTLGSFGFLGYNYMEYTKVDKKIKEVKDDINKMKDSISDEEKLKKEAEDNYNTFIEENKSKIEEIEKWQKEVNEIKALQ